MLKPFLTYQEQLDKLINEKNLIIEDLALAKEVLQNIGYFSVVGGYKTPFINKMTRIYEKGTTFEDLYALFRFDDEMRELVFKYICVIERKFRQMISYSFCSVYGEGQKEYLSKENYNYNKKAEKDIDKLISILRYQAEVNKEHAYIVHQRNVYRNVPLWVVINTLTFGQISKMFSFLPFTIQSDIGKQFKNVNEKEIERYLKNITLFRNVCAHNERLYSFKIKDDFPDKEIHKKLLIPKKGNQYLKGKKDFFGLVIAFKYLLPRDSFLRFKHSLVKIIKKYCKNSSRIDKSELLEMMGFPGNWESITRYKP